MLRVFCWGKRKNPAYSWQDLNSKTQQNVSQRSSARAPGLLPPPQLLHLSLCATAGADTEIASYSRGTQNIGRPLCMGKAGTRLVMIVIICNFFWQCWTCSTLIPFYLFQCIFNRIFLSERCREKEAWQKNPQSIDLLFAYLGRIPFEILRRL